MPEKDDEVPYCANDSCDAEALYLTATDTPLCGGCAEMYRWGQASPDEPLTLIEEE